MKKERKGLGLDTMRERARIIGGYMEIESFPFKGTRIEVVFPCKER
jgi:signal transduction histidine kinase